MKRALVGAAAGFVLGVVAMSGAAKEGVPSPTPLIVAATPQIIRATAPPPSIKVVEVTPAPRDACLIGIATALKGASVLADVVVKIGEAVIDPSLSDAEVRSEIVAIMASADAQAIREASAIDPEQFIDACR